VIRRVALVALLACAALCPARGQAQKFDVYEASIADLQNALAAGRVTSVQLVDAYLARIAAYDQAGPRLNAIIQLNPSARAEAAALDAERTRGTVRGPLHGIPVLLKDNYNTADLPTTGASIALAGVVPPTDAFAVQKLRAAGAIILGKTNLHELAAGILTVSSFGGQTLNPYDPTRNPGGSSGGTGAAVAASFAAIGWGSDTCGSIRIPAAFNSLFGLRPTKGMTSITGIIPLAHSQDVAGPLARTVSDLAMGLDATVGPDSADPATTQIARTVPRFTSVLRADALRGARLGLLKPYFGDAPEEREVGGIVRAVLERIKQLGADVIEIPFPTLDSLVANTSVIDFEFRHDLQDYLATIPGAPVSTLGDILDRGLYHAALEQTFRRRNQAPPRGSEPYRRALLRRDSLHSAVVRMMDSARIDALVYPTMRRQAVRVGEAQPGSTCQLSASTGMPALSAPAGFTSDGLPVGVELLGRRWDDAKLVGYAYAWEQSAHPRKPPRSTPPLVNGAAPPALVFDVQANAADQRLVVSGRFQLNTTTDELSFAVRVSGPDAKQVQAVVLQRMRGDQPGAVLRRLSGPGLIAADGKTALTPAEHAELLANGWSLVVFFGERAARAPVRATLAAPH
jgi:amidase